MNPSRPTPPPGATPVSVETLARAALPFVEQLTVPEALHLQKHHGARWVDVREPEEQEILAGPEDALSLPLSTLPSSALQAVPDRDVPLILFCVRGQRSALGAVRLEQAGFRRVKCLRDGLMAWVLRED
jgi:rhodanese-related sulfurtransferase